jgi:signal transduction histidine kinase
MRLAKASPLVAAALLVALAVSLPAPMPYSLLMLANPAAVIGGHGLLGANWSELYAGARASEGANLSAIEGGDPPEMFVTAATRTWQEVNVDPRELVSGQTIKRTPFASDDEVYEPIAEWERANDARVWAWIVTPPEMPPIVASARGRDGVVIEPQPVWLPGAAGADEFEPIDPTAVDDGKDAIAPWLWRELHAQDSTVPALTSDVFAGQGGSGTGTQKDARLVSTIVVDGTAWRCITVFSLSDPADAMGWPRVEQSLLEKDPRDPGYDRWLASHAREQEMDVWVFGPLDSEAIALRVPEGHTIAEADLLGDRLWPSWYLETAAQVTRPVPAELDQVSADLAGGPVGAMVLTDWTQQADPAHIPSGGVSAQSIAYLVVFDEMPFAQPGPLRSAWYAWQGLVGRNFRPLYAGGFALLLVSFVLSPAAFVADRKRRVRARVAEERERMHRDAHDKVYNRLSALSKRVADVGNTATNGTAGSLTAIAEDIRYTVGELQQILGTYVEHTSSALADASVADQLAAVCAAQAARLGVSVVCEVGADLPAVSPQLGWDFQCITEEAITNAVSHGGASEVRVGLSLGEHDTVVLLVTDNGCGSSVNSPDAAAEGSTGLRGMRDRAARHGGLTDIQGTASGTTVAVAIPLAPEPGRHPGETRGDGSS